MYSVSNAYKTALSKPAKVRRLTGYIGNVPFDDENISRGSFTIETRCADGSDISLGYAYMSSLSCVFRGIDLTGEWYGKVITVSEGLLIGQNNGVDVWEDVPLGIYTIAQADHREDGVYVEAYDNFSKLDKNFPVSTMSGNAWDFLTYAASECGISLAQTQAQIGALPNGTRSYVLFSENDIETFRDFVSWVAQYMCCFATINRQGKLELRMYGGTPVDSVGMTDRWKGAKFSDFETYYTGVSVVQIEEQETKYFGLSADYGMTYNLGANPFLQGISLQPSMMEILVALQSIRYTPFTVSRSCCPAYDLGDCLLFPDGLGAGKTGCIMMIEYNYHGEYRLEGYGANPAISTARSRVDKDISGLMSRINAGEVQFYTYTNARQIEIHDGYKQIIYVRFGSTKSTIVTFHAEVKLNAEAEVTDDVYNDIIGSIKYIFNHEELNYHPVETWMDGDHLLHLLYYIPIQGSAINTFSVRMKCDGGTITIDQGDIQCAVSGQGLVATTTFDGYIELEDNINAIPISTTPSSVDYIGEEITVDSQTPEEIELEEYVGEVDFATTPATVTKITEYLYINKQFISNLTWDEIEAYTWDEVEAEFIW